MKYQPTPRDLFNPPPQAPPEKRTSIEEIRDLVKGIHDYLLGVKQ